MAALRLIIRKVIYILKKFLILVASIIIQPNRKPRSIIILALIVVAITFLITLSFKKSGQNGTLNANDQRIEVTRAKATQTINKTFTFSLKNDKNVEVAKFKYVITDVQLQDEIIVKGQRATAVKGRTFLIVNLKIINDSSLIFEINTRDFIRLSIEGDKERFAADIHNDPVQIQAIATKPTRLGFPIDDKKRKFELFVGEIKEDKQSIKVSFD